MSEVNNYNFYYRKYEEVREASLISATTMNKHKREFLTTIQVFGSHCKLMRSRESKNV